MPKWEYGKRPIPRPLPRFDGDAHYDEGTEVDDDDELTGRISEIVGAHKSVQEWYDEQICRTQYLCFCKEWVYNHNVHVAKQIRKII